VALALTAPLLVATPAVAAPGSTTGGDPYFPAAGNGGYDVAHYGLGLTYEPASGRLDGTAVITLTATSQPAGTRTSSVCRPSRYSTPSSVRAMPCSSAIRTH